MDNFLFFPRAVAAAISDTGFAWLFGLLLAGLLLDLEGPSAPRRSLQRTAIYCAIAMLLAGLAQLYLATATMIGSSAFAAVRSQLTDVALGTHAGKKLLWSLSLTLLVLLTLCARRNWQKRSTFSLLLAEMVADAMVRSASGHAAANGDFTLSEAVQFFHLISIAVWAGCVLAAGFLVLPGMLQEDRASHAVSFTRRLSRVVTFALAVVLLSGIYNAYVGLGGSLRPLAGSQWGILLDVKVLLVLIAVGMGAANRRMIAGDRATQRAPALATSLRIEAMVMLAILAVSALLANSPPASSS